MKINFLSKQVVGIASILIVLIVAVMWLVIPAADVYASDPYLDSNIPTSGMKDKDIAAMNQHEIAWLISQNQSFRDINKVDADFLDMITSEKKKQGDDAAMPIEADFTKFEDAVVVARSVHDQAAKVIGAQYGFNAKGQVTIHDAALQTVMSGRYSLRDAHYRLVLSVHTFHRNYADWYSKYH
jgi:hypothetical protein